MPRVGAAKGFLAQSFFTGFGITLANISLFVFQNLISGATSAGIPYWVAGSFMLGAVCSIGTVLVSILTTPEIPPSEEELAALRAEKGGLGAALSEIWDAIVEMPGELRKLALVIFANLTNKYLLFLPIIGLGIAWASIMGVPYIMAVRMIPSSRYGVYMGIVNMMIVGLACRPQRRQPGHRLRLHGAHPREEARAVVPLGDAALIGQVLGHAETLADPAGPPAEATFAP